MSKRILLLCLPVIVVCVLVLGSRMHSESGDIYHPRAAAASMAQETVGRPEDMQVYSFLFGHLNHLKKQADSHQRQGKNGSRFKERFRRALVIDDDQFKQLDEIALSFESDVAKLDKKAEEIIKAFRSRYPPGRIPAGEIIPGPPPELQALQEERNQVMVRAVERLKQTLGAQEFDRFDEIVKLRLGPSIKRSSIADQPR